MVIMIGPAAVSRALVSGVAGPVGSCTLPLLFGLALALGAADPLAAPPDGAAAAGPFGAESAAGFLLPSELPQADSAAASASATAVENR
ncbi:hypothetical protein GCM10009738_52580 [Kitasatospora viridis]